MQSELPRARGGHSGGRDSRPIWRREFRGDFPKFFHPSSAPEICFPEGYFLHFLGPVFLHVLSKRLGALRSYCSPGAQIKDCGARRTKSETRPQ